MAKKQANVGRMSPQRPLQPNAAQYQQPTGGGNPGELRSSYQDPQNAIAARIGEASMNNALGAGWSTVGSPEQQRGNPPGIGAIPTGATGVRAGVRPIKSPRQGGPK